MERFVVCMCGPLENNEKVSSYFDSIRKASSEARDLQRILSKDKKDEGVYYAVYDTQEEKFVYKAIGY